MPQRMEVRICRELIGRVRELAARILELAREIAAFVRRMNPALLAIPGCGIITAARILAEVAGIERFATEAGLASYAGVASLTPHPDASNATDLAAPATASSTARSTRSWSRRCACTRPPASSLARAMQRGKIKREALRSLNRHLIRVIYRVLTSAAPARSQIAPPQGLD